MTPPPSSARNPRPQRLRERISKAANAYPGASEDFPWGERVAKVNKRVFVFLGEDGAHHPRMTVKLPESHELASSIEGVTAAGYGLGRAGWVTVDLGDPGCPSEEILLDWLEESFRAIAPTRLVAELDAVVHTRAGRRGDSAQDG